MYIYFRWNRLLVSFCSYIKTRLFQGLLMKEWGKQLAEVKLALFNRMITILHYLANTQYFCIHVPYTRADEHTSTASYVPVSDSAQGLSWLCQGHMKWLEVIRRKSTTKDG